MKLKKGSQILTEVYFLPAVSNLEKNNIAIDKDHGFTAVLWLV